MGDLKESALTQKNDCKWVRALDENGNSIRISKEDLAAVVGELIGTANAGQDGLLSKDGFFYRGNINAGSNLDDYVKAGWYYLNNNKTSGIPTYGILVVYSAGGCVRQLVFDEFSSLAKTRNKTNQGKWSGWA